jgi:peptidoglycan/LPS O-acetylase OafA/YrhL
MFRTSELSTSLILITLLIRAKLHWAAKFTSRQVPIPLSPTGVRRGLAHPLARTPPRCRCVNQSWKLDFKKSIRYSRFPSSRLLVRSWGLGKAMMAGLPQSASLVHDHDYDSLPLPPHKTAVFAPHNGSAYSDMAKLLGRKIFYSTTLKRIIPNLIPSYMSSKKNGTATMRQSGPTAYLDGVRGVASFFVLIHHYPLDYFPSLHNGYLANPKDTLFIQLPFVRIIYSGRFMVGLFFVLSGYVLAHRPLQLIHAGNTSSLLDSLSSSVFRRSMRLFLPIIISTYFVMIMIHNGWYGSLDPHIKVLPIAPIGVQTMQWLSDLQILINPFKWTKARPQFSSQLWTLPVEFRGSMVVFLFLLGFAKSKTALRMTFTSASALYFFYSATHWDMSLFLAGITLAEISLLKKRSNFSWDDITYDPKKAHLVRVVVRNGSIMLFMLSWFLACWPDQESKKSPGYIFFSSVTPSTYPQDGGRTRFWTSIAAVLMLLSLENSPILQRPFMTPLAQYLGNISYALYIVHIPICYSVGRIITLRAIEATGTHATGFFLGAALVGPLTLWVADIYWRLVDIKSVELAKWIWVHSCKT